MIELVIVITLTAILSVVVGIFIARPISSYASVTRRAELVDAADLAMRRISRDIQDSVPNSLRVKVDPNNGNRVAVEMMHMVEGMRYRAYPSPVGPFLDFTQAITAFDVLGQFQFSIANSSCFVGAPCPGNATCAAGNCRIVIYNTGANTGGSTPSDNPSPGANVYSTSAAPACSGCLPPPGSYNITPVGTTVTLSNPGAEGKVTLSSAVLFGFPSPRQRLYVVDTPVTYVCDTGAGSITRYWNYTVNQVQPTNPGASPLSTAQTAQLTKDVSSCSFVYTPGTSANNGIITMTISLTQGGEVITLMRQTSVSNVP